MIYQKSFCLHIHKKTLDFTNGDYNKVNSLFSNNFIYLRNTHIGGIKFIYETKKTRFTTGTNARQVYASNDNIDTKKNISQTVNNILPFFKKNLLTRLKDIGIITQREFEKNL